MSENWPTGGPSGNQTLPRGCTPRESLIYLGASLGQIFPDNSCGFSSVCPKVWTLLLHSSHCAGGPGLSHLAVTSLSLHRFRTNGGILEDMIIRGFKVFNLGCSLYHLFQFWVQIEGTARHAGLLLAPVEGFGFRTRPFLTFWAKKKSISGYLCLF